MAQSKRQNHKKDGANFCGFLRKTELYEVVDARKRSRYFTLFKILVSKLTACEKGSLHIAHCYLSVNWGLSNVLLCLQVGYIKTLFRSFTYVYLGFMQTLVVFLQVRKSKDQKVRLQSTLDSGIDVPTWINVAISPKKFNIRILINLYIKLGIAVNFHTKISKRTPMFIPESRVIV